MGSVWSRCPQRVTHPFELTDHFFWVPSCQYKSLGWALLQEVGSIGSFFLGQEEGWGWLSSTFKNKWTEYWWGFRPPYQSGQDIKNYSMGLYFLDLLRSLKFCNLPCFWFSISCCPMVIDSKIFKIKRACVLLLQGVGKLETIIPKGSVGDEQL